MGEFGMEEDLWRPVRSEADGSGLSLGSFEAAAAVDTDVPGPDPDEAATAAAVVAAAVVPLLVRSLLASSRAIAARPASDAGCVTSVLVFCPCTTSGGDPRPFPFSGLPLRSASSPLFGPSPLRALTVPPPLPAPLMLITLLAVILPVCPPPTGSITAPPPPTTLCPFVLVISSNTPFSSLL